MSSTINTKQLKTKYNWNCKQKINLDIFQPGVFIQGSKFYILYSTFLYAKNISVLSEVICSLSQISQTQPVRTCLLLACVNCMHEEHSAMVPLFVAFCSE